MTTRLETPATINGVRIPNRLYRAPLLECAGNGPKAVDTLIRELEPAAESGVGLVFQGAMPVRREGGHVAPNMTSAADPNVVSELSRLTDTIHEHGARIFAQLDHGGLRSMETWHEGYREGHPDYRQLAVSRPPIHLRALDAVGVLQYDTDVLSTDDAYELAADFGRCAKDLVDAGYDGIHLAGANMGLIQQFLSPYYNRRDDEFGGSPDARIRFLELVYEEIRARVGPDVPVVTKVPAESAAPRFVRRRLSLQDGVHIAQRLEDIGFDGLVPVETSVFWDMSIVRGRYPERAWTNEKFEGAYERAFGGPRRTTVVSFLNRLQARQYSFESAWNQPYCAQVRDAVSVPVFAEGGIRGRSQMNRLLGEGSCDFVGMGRPFYAEPRIATRLLDDTQNAEAVCENCNNCTVPQVTGARGVCRTPDVLQKKGELEKKGAYERDGAE